MKLTPGQFHQHLHAAFTFADPKSAKRYWQLDRIFTLLGSALVKAASKKLMKLTPGVNFTNVLWTAFTLVDPERVKKIDNLTIIFTHLLSVCIKAGRKMLMRSTPGRLRSRTSFVSFKLESLKRLPTATTVQTFPSTSGPSQARCSTPSLWSQPLVNKL